MTSLSKNVLTMVAVLSLFGSSAFASQASQSIEMQKSDNRRNCELLLRLTEDSIVKFHNQFSYYTHFKPQYQVDADQLQEQENSLSTEVYSIYNIMIGNLNHAIDVCMYVERYDDLVEKLIELQKTSHEFHKYLEVLLFNEKRK